MSGAISIKPLRTIADLQEDFNRVYPYLRIDFYKAGKHNNQYHAASRLDRQLPLKTCGIGREGEVVLSDNMTVAELENRSAIGLEPMCRYPGNRGGCGWKPP